MRRRKIFPIWVWIMRSTDNRKKRKKPRKKRKMKTTMMEMRLKTQMTTRTISRVRASPSRKTGTNALISHRKTLQSTRIKTRNLIKESRPH